MDKKLDFKIKKTLLKEFGASLYSNSWTAISELVANGLDADATKIYIIYHTVGANKTDLYVIDNGSGMNEELFKNNYAALGLNRREDSKFDNSDKVRGRKGIGKLAALFLTNHYTIISKHDRSDLIGYELDMNKYSDSDSPKLELVNGNDVESIVTTISKFADITLSSENSYTIIKMEDVNMKSLGEKYIESFAKLLASRFNFFDDSSVKINIVEMDANYEITTNIEARKDVLFENMSEIIVYDKHTMYKLQSILTENGEYKEIRFTKDGIKQKIKINDYSDNNNYVEINDIKYEIRGWIGTHASIKLDVIEQNVDGRCEVFKNKYYSPIALRVYTRDKLAINNMLPSLNNTQAFANYIEGELTFDVLDDNEFEDIATSSREAVNESDIRFQRLVNKIKIDVNKLISNRVSKKSKVDLDKKSNAKFQAKENIKRKIDEYDFDKNNQQINKSDIIHFFTSELEGDLSTCKSKYKLFLSHASDSKYMSDIVYNILLRKGTKKEEIFYTSAPNFDVQNIGKEIVIEMKNNIIETNSKLVYFFSDAFLSSQFTLCEAGAGWATRTDDKLIFLTDKGFDSIPNFFLSKSKARFKFNDNDSFRKWDKDVCVALFSQINLMIEHLNKGRGIMNENKIELLKCKSDEDYRIGEEEWNKCRP